MLVPDYNGRHRLNGQDRRRRMPVWLRPTTWLLNVVLVTTIAFTFEVVNVRPNY
jgi:hypothetical protein